MATETTRRNDESVEVREEWDDRRGLRQYFVNGEWVNVKRHHQPPYFLVPPAPELREMVDKLNVLIKAIELPPVLRGTVTHGEVDSLGLTPEQWQEAEERIATEQLQKDPGMKGFLLARVMEHLNNGSVPT